LTGNKIIDAWRLNQKESDDPIAIIESILRHKISNPSTTETEEQKTDSKPTISVSLIPPESLILGSPNNKSITISEKFGAIVLSRLILTDGKLRTGELPDGANYSVQPTRENKILNVETISPRGNRLTENYALVAEGMKLVVSFTFDDGRATELLRVRHVYDRAFLNPFSIEAARFQWP